MHKILLAIYLAATALVVGCCGAAVAADDSSAGTPDCSKASTMMQGMAPASGAMMSNDHATGVDADYLKSMKAMLDHQSTMAKMEMACGSNATVKANAKKSLEDIQSLNDEVTKLLRSIGV